MNQCCAIARHAEAPCNYSTTLVEATMLPKRVCVFVCLIWPVNSIGFWNVQCAYLN